MFHGDLETAQGLRDAHILLTVQIVADPLEGVMVFLHQDDDDVARLDPRLGR